jgi:hypothetical protein
MCCVNCASQNYTIQIAIKSFDSGAEIKYEDMLISSQPDLIPDVERNR